MKQRATVSVRETALRLGVTLKYVYDLVYSGRLPASKSGRVWGIDARAVRELAKRRWVDHAR